MARVGYFGCVGLSCSVLLLVGCADFVGASEAASTGGATAAGSSSGERATGSSATTATTGPGAPETAGDSNTTASEDDTGSASASESSGATEPAVCGNGITEEGEACDDANRDDTDGCTVNCELSSCRDGRQNGTETDEDCGGACVSSCDAGEGCEVGADCTDGVCGADGTCATAACDDGVLNNGEITVDCGPVCATAPANVLLNGDFESGSDDWVVENAEINPQSAYFNDGSANAVVEIDRSGNTTSRWQQGFQVPEYQVGLTLALRLRVGDRNSAAGDEGGLLIRITGPDRMPLPLSGMAGATFNNNGSGQLGVDATSVGSFETVIVHFDSVASGGHVLELLEQTSGGQGLNDGGGLVLDDVEVLLVNCEG